MTGDEMKLALYSPKLLLAEELTGAKGKLGIELKQNTHVDTRASKSPDGEKIPFPLWTTMRAACCGSLDCWGTRPVT